MALISQLGSLELAMLQQSLAVRIAITLLILAAGLGLARVGARLTRYLWERKVDGTEMVELVQHRGRSPERAVSYLIILFTLGIATLYINASAANRIMSQIAAYVPRIMTAVLVFLFGVVLVRGAMEGVRMLIHNLDVREYAEDIGVSTKLIDAFFAAVRVFLYLVVVEIAIIQVGVSPQIVNSTIVAASYGIVLLLVLLGFFGFKDLIQNYAAGVYLRGSDVLNPGKRVKVDDETGEIRDISMFGTTITTDSGYFMLTPNQRLMDKEILFKRVKSDVETLEDITDYFVADRNAAPGAAAGEMGLAIFGFDITQGDISERLSDGESGPETVGEVLAELTDGEVRVAYVPADKMSDTASEFKTWFNNGALLMPYFSKSVLFPASDADQFVLCVGVEGDELLVVDPTTGDSGGVYFVDATEMQRAMDRADGGYLVLAPRGTTAFWRVKNDLIYSSLSFYRQLSKSLEVQLSKILRRGDVLKQVVPESVNDFIDRWTVEEDGDRVTRMWTPEDRETQIDEFTDDI